MTAPRPPLPRPDLGALRITFERSASGDWAPLSAEAMTRVASPRPVHTPGENAIGAWTQVIAGGDVRYSFRVQPPWQSFAEGAVIERRVASSASEPARAPSLHRGATPAAAPAMKTFSVIVPHDPEITHFRFLSHEHPDISPDAPDFAPKVTLSPNIEIAEVVRRAK